jgi:hypothetical protein
MTLKSDFKFAIFDRRKEAEGVNRKERRERKEENIRFVFSTFFVVILFGLGGVKVVRAVLAKKPPLQVVDGECGQTSVKPSQTTLCMGVKVMANAAKFAGLGRGKKWRQASLAVGLSPGANESRDAAPPACYNSLQLRSTQINSDQLTSNRLKPALTQLNSHKMIFLISPTR